MAENILLIREVTIKSQTIIEKNVDSETLQHITWQVQEHQLQPVLGKTVYETLMTEVGNMLAEPNTYAIPELYLDLLHIYVKPFLLTAITAEFAFVNTFKVTNKGVMKLNDNSANAASAEEINTLRNYYNNQLSTCKANLIKYLKDNNLLDNCTDTNTTSSIGWYFDLN